MVEERPPHEPLADVVERASALERDGYDEEAIDLIWKHFDKAMHRGLFEEIDGLLSKPEGVPTDVLMSLLTVTSHAPTERLPNRKGWARDAGFELTRRGCDAQDLYGLVPMWTCDDCGHRVPAGEFGTPMFYHDCKDGSCTCHKGECNYPGHGVFGSDAQKAQTQREDTAIATTANVERAQLSYFERPKPSLPQPGWGYMGAVRIRGVWSPARGGTIYESAPACLDALKAMYTELKGHDMRAIWFHPGDDRCACQGEWGRCETCGGVGYV
jgi:hypothetical protein